MAQNVGQLIVIDTSAPSGNQPVATGTVPPAGAPFTFVIVLGALFAKVITLLFTDPNGVSHSAVPSGIASRQTMAGTIYSILYAAAQFEFNKPGPWRVLVKFGSYTFGTFPFLIGPPASSIIPKATPVVQAMLPTTTGGVPFSPTFLTNDQGTIILTDDSGA